MKPRRGHSKDYQNRNIKLAIADIIWYRIFQWWCILRTLKLHPSPHTSQPKLWQNYLSEAPSDKGVEHTKNCFDKNAPIHDHLKITFIRFACALSLFPCPPPHSKKMLLETYLSPTSPFAVFFVCGFALYYPKSFFVWRSQTHVLWGYYTFLAGCLCSTNEIKPLFLLEKDMKDSVLYTENNERLTKK